MNLIKKSPLMAVVVVGKAPVSGKDFSVAIHKSERLDHSSRDTYGLSCAGHFEFD